MRRTLAQSLAILVAAALLTAAAALPAHAQRTPNALRIVTNPQGSLFYRAGTAVAKVLSGHMSIPARVQPYAGTSVALPLINTGEVEMGVNNTNDVRMALRGMKPFLPAPNLRLVTVLFTLRVAMFVRNDSPIRTVADLRGKRVSSEYKAQLAVWFNTTSILGGAGLGWDDVKGVPTANVVTGTDALIEDRVDATLFALGAGKVREANAKISGGIRFLSIDTSPDGIAAMQRIMPGTYPLKVKGGSTVGVIDDITVEAYDCFITSSPNIDEKTIYEVVKVLHAAEKEVQGSFPPFRSFARSRMVKDNVTIPYHDGAIRAFKELGLWDGKMDKVQADLLAAAMK